jgi:hypothetical protein
MTDPFMVDGAGVLDAELSGHGKSLPARRGLDKQNYVLCGTDPFSFWIIDYFDECLDDL